MSIYRNLPEVTVLLQRVQDKLGFSLNTHEDFVEARNCIFEDTKENISETTLERVWGYSTRGYDNISLRTLNVLCHYIGQPTWEEFCLRLSAENRSESDMFDRETVSSKDLHPGDTLIIGWQPDRVCTIRYLGDNRYVAVETANSKLKVGDKFSCLQFQLGVPLFLEDLTSATGELIGKKYGVGLKHGLSMLRIKS